MFGEYTDTYRSYGNTNPYDGSGAGGYNNHTPPYPEDSSYGGAPNQRYGGRDGYGGTLLFLHIFVRTSRT